MNLFLIILNLNRLCIKSNRQPSTPKKVNSAVTFFVHVTWACFRDADVLEKKMVILYRSI